MIKWGLVGCGDIAGKRVAPAIQSQKDSELFSVMSPHPDEVETFKSLHLIEKGFTTLDAMLADEEISAVYVATPVFLHYDAALSALSTGKHVLVEKPMAMTVKECKALVNEAEKNRVKLGVAYYRRFFPTVIEARRLISEGVIGDVVFADIQFHSWYDPKKEDPKYWRVVRSKGGGGPLWDMGAHKLDLLIWMLGMPVGVSGTLKTLVHSYETEDSCTAALELESGAFVNASFHWNSAVWTDRFEILGTKGKLIFAPADGDTLQLERPPQVSIGMGKEITSMVRPAHTNVHAPLVEDFVQAILCDRDPLISGVEGLKTNVLLAAIEESSMLKQQIKVSCDM